MFFPLPFFLFAFDVGSVFVHSADCAVEDTRRLLEQLRLAGGMRSIAIQLGKKRLLPPSFFSGGPPKKTKRCQLQ